MQYCALVCLHECVIVSVHMHAYVCVRVHMLVDPKCWLSSSIMLHLVF